jgi:type I restriction enzyme M protein
MLVDNFLAAVISLPAGVFNPYSGVKTSIMIFDRTVARASQHIAYFKVENDGFALGAQRKAIKGTQLPQVKDELLAWLAAARTGGGDELNSPFGFAVGREQIAAAGDYNLSGERYRKEDHQQFEIPRVPIGELCVVNPQKSELRTMDPNTEVSFVPMATLNEWRIDFEPDETRRLNEVSNSYTYFANGDVLLAKVTPCFENGKAGVAKRLQNGIAFGSSEFYVIRPGERVLSQWIYRCIMHDAFRSRAIPQMTGTGGLRRVPRAFLEQFKIPLPPLEVQREIVAEIEGYQRVIDGARAVIDNYRPHIPANLDWPIAELAEIATFLSGGTPSKANEAFWQGDIPWVSAKDLKTEQISDALLHVSEEAVEQTATQLAPVGSILVLVRGMGLANSVPFAEVMYPCAFNQDLKAIVPKPELVHSRYLAHSLRGQFDYFRRAMETAAHGTLKLNSETLKSTKIPLPTLEVQQGIIAEIEAEQALVNGNRDLITRFEDKIDAAIARVWSETKGQEVA